MANKSTEAAGSLIKLIERGVLFGLVLAFNFSYIQYEQIILEKYGLVFYYVLSPGENPGPIGDPLLVMFVLLLGYLNYNLLAFPGVLEGRYGLKENLLIGALNSVCLLFTGLRA